MNDGKVTLYPLRERRKSRTREALIKASQELIAETSYDGFTLEQVAERAEVHVQTLYRHFPTKDDLIKAGTWIALEELEGMIANRAKGESTLQIWRTFVLKHADNNDRAIHHFQLSHDKHLLGQSRYIAILTEGLAKDLGKGSNKRRAYLIACLIKAANDLEYNNWVIGGRKGKLKTKMARLINDIEENFLTS